jgi:O-antigen ligase
MIGTQYQRVLAMIGILLFYTNLALYLYSSDRLPVKPWYWIAGFGVLASPLLFSGRSARMKQSPLILWAVGFLMISATWLLFQPLQSEVAWGELRSRVYSIAFLLIALLVFSHEDAQMWARRAILLSVLVGIALNIYEFFHPATFVPVIGEYKAWAIGRSGGLYINPNESGAALVLGMILSIGVLGRRLRLAFILLVGLGVLLTFSRGALLIWGISALMTIKLERVISTRSLIITCGILASIALLAVLSQPLWGKLQLELQSKGALNQDIIERSNFFGNAAKSGVRDESGNDRVFLAKRAWTMIGDSPIVGYGVGGSLSWGLNRQAHNQYLSLMLEHGIFGLFVFPLLLMAAVWRARGEARRTAFVFAGCVLAWGLFSHNILGDYFILILLSLLSAMSVSSRLKQRSEAASVESSTFQFQGSFSPVTLSWE